MRILPLIPWRWLEAYSFLFVYLIFSIKYIRNHDFHSTIMKNMVYYIKNLTEKKQIIEYWNEVLLDS